MKFKATKKEMKENYSKIIKLGYCSAEGLLHYRSPIAYSTRAEGWACDYYQVGNVLISTGYAPIGNIVPDYDIVEEYNNKAWTIINCYLTDYEKRKELVEDLLAGFMSAVF